MTAALAGAARRIMPVGVAVAAVQISGDHPAVLAAEMAATVRMIPRRRQEFTAGRAAIRQAMAELAMQPQPVVMGADRAPMWPIGFTGSLAHDTDTCIAVLSCSDRLRSIGIDLEPDTALDADLIATICDAEERGWLATQPGDQRGRIAKLMFCAKEAAYKAQYPLTGQIFGFDHLTVTISLAQSSFAARFNAAALPFHRNDRLAGNFIRAEGKILTVVSIPTDAP